jgi:polyisoprenoid-binding protein YceI
MRLLILSLSLFLSFSASAQLYTVSDGASSVSFVISNLGFKVNGSLKGISGTINFNEANLSAASFTIQLDSKTIDTDNSLRDKHLRGEDYFDVPKYPLITLTTVKVAKSLTPGYFVLFARLTVKGKTQEISFPFTATKEGSDYRFKGSFPLKRRDFGIGGRNTISNDLTVNLNVLAKKK